MTPTERGRFCAMCTKEVVDFTRMSDAQLVKFISQTENSICGHVKQNQLNRTIAVLNEPKSQILYRPWYERVLAATVFLFTFGSVKSQSQPNVNEIDQNQATTIETYFENTIPNSDESNIHEIILRGVVLDSLSNDPLAFAYVECKSFNLKVQTNLDGMFELKLALSEMIDSIVIQVHFSGYENKNITIYKSDYHYSITVYLPEILNHNVMIDQNDLVDGKIMVVRGKIDYREPKPESKSQRFWRRMKFWKRRR